MFKFKTKGYTISYFIKVLSSTTNTQLRNGVSSVLSPRKGATSVKVRVLNSLLSGNTSAILNGTGRFASYGSTPRGRLLTALRNRKRNGSV